MQLDEKENHRCFLANFPSPFFETNQKANRQKSSVPPPPPPFMIEQEKDAFTLAHWMAKNL